MSTKEKSNTAEKTNNLTAKIIIAISENPGYSDRKIAKLLTGGTSGYVRSLVAEARRGLSAPTTAPAPTSAPESSIAWRPDETARWEKTAGVSSLFVRPTQEISSIESICNAALTALSSSAPALPLPEEPAYAFMRKAEGLLVIGLSDLHLSKLAHVSTTGESWNREIAGQTALNAVQGLINRAQGQFNRIVITCGNDLLHTDDGRSTTSGTPQDSSDLYHVAAEAAIALMVRIVGLCAKYAPVDILVVPGNHARRGDWWVGRVLAATFKNSTSVTVECTPRDRLYYRWKHLLLGFTHGDGIKPAALPMLMATEAGGHWAATNHREWLIGHTHAGRQLSVTPRSQYEELPGVTITTMPAMCAPDVWHSASGYTGNRRTTQAYLYHSDGSKTIYEICTHTHSAAATARVITGGTK